MDLLVLFNPGQVGVAACLGLQIHMHFLFQGVPRVLASLISSLRCKYRNLTHALHYICPTHMLELDKDSILNESEKITTYHYCSFIVLGHPFSIAIMSLCAHMYTHTSTHSQSVSKGIVYVHDLLVVKLFLVNIILSITSCSANHMHPRMVDIAWSQC